MLDGRPAYTYNWVGLEMYTVAAREKLAAGRHTITFDFAYKGGRGGGGKGTISRNGVAIGEGLIKKTNSNTFGIDESADVGVDENTPVFPGYKNREKFTGKINKITIETFAKR
jgi:arylsulfatase